MASDNPVQNTRLLVDGAWTDAQDGGTFATVNPADGETVPGERRERVEGRR